MKRSVRSNFLAMRASARFGRAVTARESGQSELAMRLGRETLAILGHPDVIRFNPAEGSVLSCATVLVEELAAELNVPGASPRDIGDALRYIRAVGPEGEFTHWIPYLEQRVMRGSIDAV